MKIDFKFSNLLGTVYTQGNLVFTPDGNSILSPVGNRVSVFDLVNNKSITLPFENQKNIRRIALSPNAAILLSVDEDGRVLLVNYPRRVVLHKFNFGMGVTDVKFSPDGKYFAVTHEKFIEVWKSPGFNKEFAPFVLHRKYTGHYDDVVGLSWSGDSQYFISCSKDMTARIYSVNPIEGFTKTVLSGHKDTVVGAFFTKNQKTIYTVGHDGVLFVRKYMVPKDSADEHSMDIDTEGNNGENEKQTATKRWVTASKHFFNTTSIRVVCVEYHVEARLLVVGFSTGIFGIWEMPDFNNIHTLSISQTKITSLAINKSSEWLAFGSSKQSQLLVWEWQSESYVLKQQGHYYDMNTLSYSPDSQTIATGADDGKLKLWNTISGFCFVTFTEHSSAITQVEFAKNGQVVFSSSLDGTVRAFDLIRYRNFRTFTTPSPIQFTCLCVDPSGEVICAGSMDTFEIYVWSVQTGKLLDILSGHEGPISGLAFSPNGTLLASSSWDYTARTWDIFGRSKNVEVFRHTSDVLAIAFKPDGKQLACSTLDGQIAFWDVERGTQIGTVEGRKDISGGRKVGDRTTAANSTSGKAFNSLSYTADGSCILAGGNSKYVCVYEVRTALLIKKFTISKNRSLDGVMEFLNSKNMTEAGPKELIDETGDISDLEDRIDKSLPGIQTGDLSVRKTMPEVRTKCVRFSPAGRSWAAASTEGLIIYSLDETLLFDPFNLDITITPSSILSTLLSTDYLKSLVMAFRLNESYLIQKVYESIPPSDVPFVVKEIPQIYLDKLIKFIAISMETTPHVEFHLLWVRAIVKSHGGYLRTRLSEYMIGLRSLSRCVTKVLEDIGKM
ncbi:5860_t:CDS:2 [Paraglomus brasilianum]|uniref:5860_t:CDS:1 n=1 Tax=Paraglomus brasilianum TaxID=144538 RepID=A0A9N8VEC2_9GLOM|nr:5860_t:CDS:2 [Paraglomus brasilianum]